MSLFHDAHTLYLKASSYTVKKKQLISWEIARNNVGQLALVDLFTELCYFSCDIIRYAS
jgi:hypothetical protein